MKKQYISMGIDTAHYGKNIIELMNKTTHCLNCGKKLRYLDKEKRRNRGYCSLSCYYAKPVKAAYIEQEYGKPLQEVVVELLNKNDNVTLTAQLLGLNKERLYNYLRKYNIRRRVQWEVGKG